MPTFKHPCPFCGRFIDRAVAVCPFCMVHEPFTPRRCPKCRRIIEDLAWKACPGCASLLSIGPNGEVTVLEPPAAGTAVPSPQSPGPAPVQPAPPANEPVAVAGPATPNTPTSPAAGQPCSGCGSPVPAGALFCAVCGTLVE